METKLRQPNRTIELQNELEFLRNHLQAIEMSRAQLNASYMEKCREHEELLDMYNTNIVGPTSEIQRLKLENTENAKMYEILSSQLETAESRVKYLTEVMTEKDSYIEALEDAQTGSSSHQIILELEERCRQLMQ